MRRRCRRLPALLLAMVFPVVLGLAACRPDAPLPVPRHLDWFGTPAGPRAELTGQTPVGRLSLLYSAAESDLPPIEGRPLPPSQDPPDTVYLQTSLIFTPDAGVPLEAFIAPMASYGPPELTAVAIRFEGEPGTDAGTVPISLWDPSWAAVHADHAVPLGLRITFDGLTYETDRDGRVVPDPTGADSPAARMIDLPPAEERSCRGALREHTTVVVPRLPRLCSYRLQVYPYAPGLGWASRREPGAVWALVWAHTWIRDDLLTLAGEPCPDDGFTRRVTGRVTVTVDGRPRALEVPMTENPIPGGPGLSTREVFLVPDLGRHRLSVASSWTCRSAGRARTVGFADHVVHRMPPSDEVPAVSDPRPRAGCPSSGEASGEGRGEGCGSRTAAVPEAGSAPRPGASRPRPHARSSPTT